MMSDRYGHKILAGEFRFCGSYLSKIEKNFSEVVWINQFWCFISPQGVFESFVEVNIDLAMNTSMYLALCEQAK